MNQGTEWGLLMKKKKSQKSRASVPLNDLVNNSIQNQHRAFQKVKKILREISLKLNLKFTQFDYRTCKILEWQKC